MFWAQDSGIARGQTLRVATKKCVAWSCFSVKSGVFGPRGGPVLEMGQFFKPRSRIRSKTDTPF